MFNFKCKERFNEKAVRDVLKQQSQQIEYTDDTVFDVIHIQKDRYLLMRELEPHRYQCLQILPLNNKLVLDVGEDDRTLEEFEVLMTV